MTFNATPDYGPLALAPRWTRTRTPLQVADDCKKGIV